MTGEPDDQMPAETEREPDAPVLEPFRKYAEIDEGCGGCGAMFSLNVDREDLGYLDRKHREWAEKHKGCLGIWADRYAIGDFG